MKITNCCRYMLYMPYRPRERHMQFSPTDHSAMNINGVDKEKTTYSNFSCLMNSIESNIVAALSNVPLPYFCSTHSHNIHFVLSSQCDLSVCFTSVSEVATFRNTFTLFTNPSSLVDNWRKHFHDSFLSLTLRFVCAFCFIYNNNVLCGFPLCVNWNIRETPTRLCCQVSTARFVRLQMQSRSHSHITNINSVYRHDYQASIILTSITFYSIPFVRFILFDFVGSVNCIRFWRAATTFHFKLSSRVDQFIVCIWQIGCSHGNAWWF